MAKSKGDPLAEALEARDQQPNVDTVDDDDEGGDVEEPDEGADVDGDDDTEGDEGEGEEVDDWTPPTKEEWEAQRKKLERARSQAARLRKQQQTPQPAAKKAAPAKKAAAKKQTPPPEPEEPEDDTPQGPSEDEVKWQTRAIRSAARAGLGERGADQSLVELALTKIKPEDVDFDDDGDPDLETWLDDMEDKYPSLFKPQQLAKQTQQRRAGSVDQGAAAAGGGGKKPKMLGDQILSSAGYRPGRRT